MSKSSKSTFAINISVEIDIFPIFFAKDYPPDTGEKSVISSPSESVRESMSSS
jgi:hypothetical protein